MGRFERFSDEEVYMLKRQAIESSQDIFIRGNYTQSQKDMHTSLMNELVRECGRRDDRNAEANTHKVRKGSLEFDWSDVRKGEMAKQKLEQMFGKLSVKVIILKNGWFVKTSQIEGSPLDFCVSKNNGGPWKPLDFSKDGATLFDQLLLLEEESK